MKNETVKSNPFKVGDIFDHSWGYDQTNIDFYQVVSVKPASVVVRKLQSTIRGSGFQSMSGYTKPIAGQFADDETKLCRVKSWCGEPVIIMRQSFCDLWDGQEKYCSWYA